MLPQALGLRIFSEETKEIFFDASAKIVDYLHIKNSQLYYVSINPGLLARKRHEYY